MYPNRFKWFRVFYADGATDLLFQPDAGAAMIGSIERRREWAYGGPIPEIRECLLAEPLRIEEISAWRADQSRRGLACGLDDFYRATGICHRCNRSGFVHCIDHSHGLARTLPQTELCTICKGRGVLTPNPWAALTVRQFICAAGR